MLVPALNAGLHPRGLRQRPLGRAAAAPAAAATATRTAPTGAAAAVLAPLRRCRVLLHQAESQLHHIEHEAAAADEAGASPLQGGAAPELVEQRPLVGWRGVLGGTVTGWCLSECDVMR